MSVHKKFVARLRAEIDAGIAADADGAERYVPGLRRALSIIDRLVGPPPKPDPREALLRLVFNIRGRLAKQITAMPGYLAWDLGSLAAEAQRAALNADAAGLEDAMLSMCLAAAHHSRDDIIRAVLDLFPDQLAAARERADRRLTPDEIPFADGRWEPLDKAYATAPFAALSDDAQRPLAYVIKLAAEAHAGGIFSQRIVGCILRVAAAADAYERKPDADTLAKIQKLVEEHREREVEWISTDEETPEARAAESDPDDALVRLLCKAIVEEDRQAIGSFAALFLTSDRARYFDAHLTDESRSMLFSAVADHREAVQCPWEILLTQLRPA